MFRLSLCFNKGFSGKVVYSYTIRLVLVLPLFLTVNFFVLS